MLTNPNQKRRQSVTAAAWLCLFVGAILVDNVEDVIVALAPNLVPLHGVDGAEHRLGADNEVAVLIGKEGLGVALSHIADKGIDIGHGVQTDFDSHNGSSFLWVLMVL
jgi:hypothetical protein